MRIAKFFLILFSLTVAGETMASKCLNAKNLLDLKRDFSEIALVRVEKIKRTGDPQKPYEITLKVLEVIQGRVTDKALKAYESANRFSESVLKINKEYVLPLEFDAKAKSWRPLIPGYGCPLYYK